MSTLVGGPAPQRPIPRSPEVKQFLYDNAAIGDTRRARQIDRYLAHYHCNQYAHQMHDWWGLSADQMETISPEVQVPFGFTQPALALNVRQRRPTVPFNLCKAVVDRFTGLLLSDSRRPDVVWEGDAETDDFMHAVMDQMRFWPKMREARTMGGAAGSVLMTTHLRDGQFGLEIHNPRHLQIVWKDRRLLLPAAVLIMYKHVVEEEAINARTGQSEGMRNVEYLYRRIITEDDDTVFLPLRIEPGTNVEITWEVESEVAHNMGFFPGVWVQNLSVLEREDGDPDCSGAWQGFDTIDRLLAQMNKAVLLNLDPTLTLAVDPKVVQAQGGGVRTGSDNALYVGQGGSAHYLEITGSGIEAGNRMFTLVKQNTLDVIRCVLVDPQTISGSAQSAQAMKIVYAPMLEKADDLRAQYGDLCIIPLLKIVERMVRAYTGDRIIDGKRVQYKFRLPPKVVTKPVPEDAPPGTTPETVLVDHTIGHGGGYIRLKWGPYFAPTETDKLTAVQSLMGARGGSLLDEETAVTQAATLFGVQNTNEVLRKVRAEKEKDAASADAGAGMPFGGGEEGGGFG
jgi:hypothetical protein